MRRPGISHAASILSVQLLSKEFADRSQAGAAGGNGKLGLAVKSGSPRRPRCTRNIAGEELPTLEPDLMLEDAAPFRLSRNHFSIEKRDGSYQVRDLWSTLGTIVNGEPIGDHFRADDALLRAGENEVIAGGVESRLSSRCS
jgi:hypothetical protein